MKLKIVFFGSSKYSVIGAEKINKKFPFSLIITKANSPVQAFGKKNKINTLIADKLSDLEIKQISKYKSDFLIVEDYGLILPNELLNIPKKAALNIHHSLLPKYRGPTPAPSAILNGEKVSGVTVIKMTEEVDAGPILGQERYELKSNETTDSLLTALNSIGAELLVNVISNYIKGQIRPSSQDDSKATYTEHLTRQSGFIDISDPLEIENWKLKIERAIRAYYPWPGVWFKSKLNGKEQIIKLLPEQKIQVEGKKPMDYKDFANGYKEGEAILSTLGVF